MNANGFKDHLYQFLCCGRTNNLRLDVCTSFLERLKALKTIIENYNGYRFFSCSLLLVYDGQSNGSSSNSADIRLIDFAHTNCNEIFRDFCPREGPDDGFLKGLQTISDLLFEFVESAQKE